MDKTDRICVAGSETVVGKALLRQLEAGGYLNVIDTSSEEPDLTDRAKVDAYFGATRPDYFFLAAGKSGGIGANQKYPADLMVNNLLIQCQIIRSAQLHGTRKLLYFASSCTYPRSCPQPMHVTSLMTGPLESTSEAYAIAKIAGIKLCQAYQQQYGVNMISAIPGDIFGPGDDFGLEDSHVIAALIRKMHQAKVFGAATVEVWGSGSPRREFIFADDVADAARRPHGRRRERVVSDAELIDVRLAMQNPDELPFCVVDAEADRSVEWRRQEADAHTSPGRRGCRFRLNRFLSSRCEREAYQQNQK